MHGVYTYSMKETRIVIKLTPDERRAFKTVCYARNTTMQRTLYETVCGELRKVRELDTLLDVR